VAGIASALAVLEGLTALGIPGQRHGSRRRRRSHARAISQSRELRFVCETQQQRRKPSPKQDRWLAALYKRVVSGAQSRDLLPNFSSRDRENRQGGIHINSDPNALPTPIVFSVAAGHLTFQSVISQKRK
jgi:hypothetical protein